jgi:flavin reductase (DIM6/NTAB) family NADH-FMN oxidoreductase RutF/DNA-binding GntR family transcriptional regulator
VVEQAVFRDVIGRFASGVTVITTRVDDVDFGTTASAVSSLSMEPPMLLICLNRTSQTERSITASGWFAVNILGDRQADVARAFARKAPDKFRDADVVRGPHGLPLISGALAQLVCRVTETATGGTHTVFLAEVTHADAGEGHPLTYYSGRFGRFEEAHEDAAYRRLRKLIIDRDLERGRRLDVELLANELGLPEAHVFYALTKLVTEGLVARESDGHLAVKALDVRMVSDAIDARCAIEIAVVDKVGQDLAAADAATLRTLAEAAQAVASTPDHNIESLVDAGHAFHEHFIGLLDNEALLAFLTRLDIHAIWRRAGGILDQHHVGASADYFLELADALGVGDTERAKRTLYDHAATVKNDARLVIEGLGGEV